MDWTHNYDMAIKGYKRSVYKPKRTIWLGLAGVPLTLQTTLSCLFLMERHRTASFALLFSIITCGLIFIPISFYISEEYEIKRLQVLEKLDRND